MRFGWLGLLAVLGLASLQGVQAADELTGVVVDDSAADLYGEWSKSTHTPGYHGAGYIYSPPVPETSAKFSLPLPADGKYQVLVAYTPGGNRSTTALVRITTANGTEEIKVNQQKAPRGPGI